VKPPKPPRKDGQKRRRGGQPGHEQHLRTDFPPEGVTGVPATFFVKLGKVLELS
jgi:hypothetical protein